MGFTVGRLGIDVAVDDVTSWSESGDTVSVGLELTGSTQTELKQQRARLLALQDNPDELVVPVTWTEDDTVDGYYYVVSASCPLTASALTALQATASLSLRKVQGYQAPRFESRTVGALRQNSSSITTSNTQPFWAIPSSASGFDGLNESQVDEQALTGDGVTMRYFTTNGANRNELFDMALSFFIPPANFYDGAARVEVESVPVIGTQVQNEPTSWTITNDLIRVSTGSTAGEFDFEYYDGTTWQTKTFRLYEETSGSNVLGNHPHTLTVLRNGPEIVSVRLAVEGDSTGTIGDKWAYTVDFSIRRGSRILEGYFNNNNINGNWGVELATAEAGTDITGAIRATANDANGDRYLLFFPHTYTADTTQGGVHCSTGNQRTDMQFGVSVRVDGGTGTYPFADASQLGAYYGPIAEYQKLGVR